MTVRNGWLFPDHDYECQRVVLSELPKLDECMKYILDNRACVQAGGNVGVFPAYLSLIFDAVYTFEPDDENFRCMTKNLHANNIEMRKYALGDEERNVDLDFVEGNCGAHSVHGIGDIPMVTIDSLELDSCGFIQLDIEGMEYHALGGGIDTIQRFKPVILVEDKGLSEKYGIQKGEIEYLLEPFGYSKVARLKRDDLYCVVS